MKLYLTIRPNNYRITGIRIKSNDGYLFPEKDHWCMKIPTRILHKWLAVSPSQDSENIKRMMRFLQRTKQVNECQEWITKYL